MKQTDKTSWPEFREALARVQSSMNYDDPTIEASQEKKQNPETDFANQLQNRAAQKLLNWLEDSHNETFDAGDYDDASQLAIRMAYCAGFNDCRSKLLRKVASAVFSPQGTNSGDCECAKDEFCDCD